METGLKGKIVFITGAANGIGRATAVAFAREGATLGLVDIDEKAMVEVKTEVAAAGGTAHTAK
ncbi:SDR family NAD(P)-dependent oxidoreductase, partial [Rhizobium ruizarguesonis]